MELTWLIKPTTDGWWLRCIFIGERVATSTVLIVDEDSLGYWLEQDEPTTAWLGPLPMPALPKEVAA